MRFSLITLVAVTFVAACFTNVFLLTIRSQTLVAKTEKARSEHAIAIIQLTDSESVATEYEKAIARVKKLQRAKDQMLAQFNSHVESKYKLQGDSNKFSIIEIPRFQPGYFLKEFRVYVPDDFETGLRVSFHSSSRMTSGDNGRFASLEEELIRLPAGDSVLEFSFPPVERKDGSDRIATVEIDRKQAFSRKFIGQKTPGYSSTNYPFDKQKDFIAKDDLPDIVRFQPSSGTTEIQLSIVRIDNEK